MRMAMESLPCTPVLIGFLALFGREYRLVWRDRLWLRQGAANVLVRSSSDRKAGIALDHALLELRPFSLVPQRHAVHDAITQRTAFHAFTPFERPRNAHELAFHRIGRHAQRRVAMTAPIEEREMRGQRGIRNTSRALEIAAGLILKARAHTVEEQHVHRGARSLLAGHIREIDRA